MKLFFSFFVVILTATAVRSENLCLDLFQGLSKSTAYALGIQEPGYQITYGLEVEFNPHSKNQQILNDYRPKYFSETQWLRLSHAERASYYEPGTTSSERVLVRMNTAPKWMPDSLTKEAYEATGPKMIFGEFNKLQQTLRDMEARYGRGAAQVHVVFPTDARLKGNAGFIGFSGEMAQLKNLENGYEKYLKDPNNIPGKNFEHKDLATIDNGVINLTRGSEHSIFHWQSQRWILAMKFYFSTVLRAGIYGDFDHAGYEHRQFNYDYDGLLAEVFRTTLMLEKGIIKEFAPFDRNFKYTPLKRLMAKDSANKEIWQSFLAIKSELNSFLFGFRNWSEHPILDLLSNDAKEEKKALISQAQAELYLEFTEILNENNEASLRRKKMRIAIAKFAHNVQLGSLFDQFYNQALNSNKN